MSRSTTASLSAYLADGHLLERVRRLGPRVGNARVLLRGAHVAHTPLGVRRGRRRLGFGLVRRIKFDVRNGRSLRRFLVSSRLLMRSWRMKGESPDDSVVERFAEIRESCSACPCRAYPSSRSTRSSPRRFPDCAPIQVRDPDGQSSSRSLERVRRVTPGAGRARLLPRCPCPVVAFDEVVASSISRLCADSSSRSGQDRVLRDSL